MQKQRQIKISKFLSYILRHHPESIGVKLDKGGWVNVTDLLQAANKNEMKITMEELTTVVEQNDKQRFSFSEGARRIRANQGHSIPVELGLKPTAPPSILYHGTARRRIGSIREKGLLPGSREHVHLSPDPLAAEKVGRRYGKPVIIKIKADEMHRAGHQFYLSENGIWLTKFVPPQYLVMQI